MRLLKRDSSGEFSLIEDITDDYKIPPYSKIPPYAILSHTWTEGEEVSFQELLDGTGKAKTGYEKIRFCGERAEHDGLQYFWVDTCCINKSNHSELSEAITSMFRWYHRAVRCYVYLSDVSSPAVNADDPLVELPFEAAFRASRWFTRGWTLQELLAPSSVEFFSREGNRLGDKQSLQQKIHEITGITVQALQGAELSRFDLHERLSWARGRQTTRQEDHAYALWGICNVYMPLMYGEGRENAMKRLLEEIRKPSKGLDRLPYIAGSLKSSTSQHLIARASNTLVQLLWVIYSWTAGWPPKLFLTIWRKYVCPMPNRTSNVHKDPFNSRSNRPRTLENDSEHPVLSIKGYRRHDCSFPNCENNFGKGFSKPVPLMNHIKKAHEGGEHHCLEPGCSDNNGMGFSTEALRNKHFSLHSCPRYHCEVDGCYDNNNKGYSVPGDLKAHMRSMHQGDRHHCPYADCKSNHGRGFSTKQVRLHHIKTVHEGDRHHCSASGCSNNGGKGFSGRANLKTHVQLKHGGSEPFVYFFPGLKN